MSDNTVIKVEHVSKEFKLPHEKQGSIKGALIGLIRGGKRTFERQEVLKDVSFEIKKGEFFGIVGRNGSGKSTLLKMLAGIYMPTKGHIQVNGKLTPFIELGVGFNPELTGRENVFLNGALLGFNRAEMESMYDDIVAFAELEKFMDQKLKNYSSGMQVRLAFSIAIRAKTDILLIDEVLAVGDAAFQAKCFDYFYKLKDSDTTVIFVSHDRGSLERFCARGVLIDNGKLLVDGPIDEVLSKYDPIVLGQVQGGEGRVDGGDGSVELQSIKLLDDKQSTVTKALYGQPLTLEIVLKFNEETASPIPGITIWKQGVNEAVYAANNLTESKGELGKIARNSEIKLSIKVPQEINDGQYRVEVGVANKAATHYYIQEKEALTFKIVGSRNPHSILATQKNMIIEDVK